MADRQKDTKLPMTTSQSILDGLPYKNKMVQYQNQYKEQLYNQKLLNQEEALSSTPTSLMPEPVKNFRQSSELSLILPKLNKFSQSSDSSSNNNSNNSTESDKRDSTEICVYSAYENNLTQITSHHCDNNCISHNKTNDNNNYNFCCYSLNESKDLIQSRSSLLSLLSSRSNNIECIGYSICRTRSISSLQQSNNVSPLQLKGQIEIFKENSLLSTIFHLSKAKSVMKSTNDSNKNIKLVKINKNNKLDKNNKLNKFYEITTTIQLILFMILLRLKFLLFQLTKWQRTRSRNKRIFNISNSKRIFTNFSCIQCLGIFYLIMCVMTGTCKAIGQDVPTNCTFPQRWEGSWFLSGYQQSIQIKGSQFSYRGKCTASDGNKYLIVDEKGCHRCLVIYEKHKNVLQYKESECEGDSMYMDQSMNPAAMPIRSIVNNDRGSGGVAHPNINGHTRLSSSDPYLMRSNDDKNDYFCKGRETLQTLCDQIPGDALLYSLFREQAEPVKCPLKGPFTFTYNRGHGECKSPVSNIDSCTEESRLLLSFQACPDVQGTESTVEELTCLATWKDGNSRYLVGLVSHHHAISNEERFRCFVYEKISSMMAAFPGSLSNYNLKDAEYKLAQSGDATCNGLDSAEVGSRIMTLRKPPLAERCDFPTWFKGPRHWHALMGNSGYQFHPSDGSMHITKPNGYMETRALCEQINKQTSNEMMAVVHYTTGCKSGFMCMMFYRRDTHVSEIQTGTPASRLEDACAPDHFDTSKLPYITLLASNPESQICPLDGLYNLRGAIGPPYITSRHKRNHNTNYNSIKGHNQHNHHHHELQGHKRHGMINFQNSDELSHNISPIDTQKLNSHTKGHSNLNRNRRDATFNENPSTSINYNNNNHNIEQQQQNHHYSNLMRNSRTLKLAARHSGDDTNNINAISIPLNDEASTKITITQQSYNQIINETQRNRRDAPGCIVNYKAQRQLLVGCNEANQIDVRPMCSEDGDEVYLCHGSWTENGTTYIIAKHSGTQHGVCLSYRQLEGNSAKLIIGDACYRGYQKPPDHHLVANLTNFGKCSDSSSSKIIGTNIILTFTGIIFIYILIQLS